jgi:hypothetical protein
MVLVGCQPAADQDAADTSKQAAPEGAAATDSETDSRESSPEAARAPALVAVTLPAQTVLLVEMASGLSSHTSQPGQAFRATVSQEVSMNGLLAVPVGSNVYGKVTEAHPADKIGGRAELALIFHTLELTGGEPMAIAANFDLAGKSQRTKDAAMIGGGVVGGAIIGDQIDDGTGTAIGAIIGGVAGTGSQEDQGQTGRGAGWHHVDPDVDAASNCPGTDLIRLVAVAARRTHRENLGLVHAMRGEGLLHVVAVGHDEEVDR